MVYFWLTITENHKNHSRDTSYTSHWQHTELNQLKQDKAMTLWNKETMIEDGAHLSGNSIKLYLSSQGNQVDN